MRRKWLITAVVAAVAALVIGVVAIAGADEGLAEGDYSLTVPGVGTFAINVSADGVALVSFPDGYELVADDDDDDEFLLVSSTSPLVLELEIDDDEIEFEAKVDALSPGEYELVIPEVGTVLVAVGADGTVSVVEIPTGWTLVQDDDDPNEFKLISPDGSLVVEIELDDDEIEISFEAEDDHDDDDDDDDDDEDDDEDDDD